MHLSAGAVLLVVIGVSLLPFVLAVTLSLSLKHGAWRLLRALGPAAPYLFGSAHGDNVAFNCRVFALREEGKIAEAAALAKAHTAKNIPPGAEIRRSTS
jgi:hypothetical protein